GTGKTTTLVEGLKLLKGLGSKLTPSPQQKLVWEAIGQSSKDATVCFAAFSKSIATELQQRVPVGCAAMTMHSLGFKAVRNSYTLMEGLNATNAYRVSNIIAELLDQDIRQLRKDEPTLVKATEELVAKCKQNLLPLPPSREDLEELIRYYEVETNHSLEKILDLVPKVLDRCLDVNKDRCIDFNDMIWLPVVLKLPVTRYDLLLVDEAQDLNRCQQALAKMAGERLILCGDPKQAIYGFAGADVDSMPRMAEELGTTERKCSILPLTVTRRCGRKIVKEANKIVPLFDAHESNPEGKIGKAQYPIQYRWEGGQRIAYEVPWEETYGPQVKPGDFVLCRCNAPLVRECFRFLKRSIKATIQGKDIGTRLITTIEKLKATSVVDLLTKLDEWLDHEQAKEKAKKNPSESKLIELQDRADCIVCFTEGAQYVQQVLAKINSVFTDNKTSPGVRLSSVHKSKGMESHRVFLLQPFGASMPHPKAESAWQVEQEYNLLYVAITRAIEELVYVS